MISLTPTHPHTNPPRACRYMTISLKIEPDFVEHFYDEGGDVRPMVHYLPATLDNITEVVAYAVDIENDDDIRKIVSSANSWCKVALSEEGLASDSIIRLDDYRRALDSYDGGSWVEEWVRIRRRFDETINDLVDCDAWSYIDWFTFPSFAGL